VVAIAGNLLPMKEPAKNNPGGLPPGRTIKDMYGQLLYCPGNNWRVTLLPFAANSNDH
jgi:hypothetical protein